MADRWRSASEADLDAALRRLGRTVAYPPTPPIAAAVQRRLAEPRPQRGPPIVPLFRMSWATRIAALAAVALLLIAAGLVGVSPEARRAVADRLGVRGVDVRHVPTAAVVTPPRGASAGERLALGEPMTLAGAAGRVQFRVLSPGPELGPPDAVYVGEPPAGGQVSFVYEAAPDPSKANETGVGLLLTQLRGDLEPAFLRKGLGPGTRIEYLTVDGEEAVWIEGEAHLFYYQDANGEIRDESLRLAGNVLLWQRQEVTLRLEGAHSRDEALRIAAGLR